MNDKNGKTILFFSIPLSLLIAVASCTGIFTPYFYIKETFNCQVQSVGQDMVDLLIVVPALIGTAILVY